VCKVTAAELATRGAKAAAVVQAAVDHTEQVVAVQDTVVVMADRRCSYPMTMPSYWRAACCG
jgi:hypothetical protein